MWNTSKLLKFSIVTAMAMAIPMAANGAELPEDPYTYTWHELADGVWSGVRENAHLSPVMGTSTFVIGDDGVIVFDGGGAPIMTDRLMAKIAELTDKPITHLVVSHWHGDHMFGVWRIVEEFPNVEVIMHSFTHGAILGAPLDYLKRQNTAIERYVPVVEDIIAKHKSGENVLVEEEIEGYEYLLSQKDLLNSQFKIHNYVLPTLTFENRMVIYSGETEVHLMNAGHGNTDGDVIMWMPKEKIVATGDVIVWPTPYSFNVAPRRWVATMEAIKALEYEVLVPGHGEIQWDTNYIDLLIEAATSVADQTDQFIADGMSQEEAGEALDFSAFKERFTGGSDWINIYYNAYFTSPLRSSAWRAAKGELMVKLEREPEPEEEPADDSNDE